MKIERFEFQPILHGGQASSAFVPMAPEKPSEPIEEDGFEALPLASNVMLSEDELAARLAEAELAGFTKGKAEGAAEMQAAFDAAEAARQERLAQHYQRVAEAINHATQAMEADSIRQQEEVGTLAMAIARRVVGALLTEEPAALLQTQIITRLREMREEPLLRLRLSPVMVQALTPHQARLTSQSGFRGQLAIEEDATLGDAECSIVWPSGSASYSLDRVWEAVAHILRPPAPTITEAEPQTERNDG
jgi:flagellar biosynthesis/type III secretory pathway protein FliH